MTRPSPVPIALLMDAERHYRNLENLIHNLNNQQASFTFRRFRARGLGRRLARLRYSTDELMAKIRESRTPGDGDFPVLVTDASFPDIRYAFMDTEQAMLISVAALAGLKRGADPRRFLCVMIADLLINMFAATPVHEECIGCVGDAPRTNAELRKCLYSMEFCSRCKSIIRTAVRDGELTERQRLSVERILDYGASRRRCFVLMPFKRSFLPVFAQGMQRAGKARGWSVERADQRLDDPQIMAEVLEGIRTADLLVADLTGSTPNVMYELGYAHALEKTVVLLTQHGDDVPFDVREKRVHEYKRSDMAGLRSILDKYLAG